MCCGWVKGPLVTVADYDDGPSIFASESLAVGASFDQLPPRRGDSANVTASCPSEAGVGNAQIRLLTNDDPNNQFGSQGMDSYGVIQVVDVAADAYQPGDAGQLTFVASILIPDDAPSTVAVYVSSLRSRRDWTPDVRMTPISQALAFDLSP